MAKLKNSRAAKRGGRLKTALLGVCALVALALFCLSVWVWQVAQSVELDVGRITNAGQTLHLYDGSGEQIASLHGAEDRTAVSLEEIPQHVRNAFLAVEDVRFYSHSGIDIKRIFGALLADLRSGSLEQGASTITQQLIKLSHLTSEKTLERKVQEAILALELEAQYSKDEILEMYLNYVYFGGGAYGIESAAWRYFGIHASELTVAQGALLAGIVKSPSNYAPHLDPEASVKRRDLVLSLMAENGFLTEEEAQEAMAEPLVLNEQADTGYDHGYYVDAALDEACELLGLDREGLYSGGYRVYTYLDTELQELCEALFEDPSLFPEDAADGEPVQAALTVIDPESFGVTALLGGRSYDVQRGFNRATDMRRQPGSTIKPVLVYAPAIDRFGYTAASVMLDEPTDFGGYQPQNYGNKYYGLVTLREAMLRSLNVPAVKLLSNIGVRTGKTFAERLGISFDPADNSLSLALGGFTYGVSPLSLCGAYASFAAGGLYESPCFVQKITDSQGVVLYERTPNPQRVMDERTAFLLTSMMQSCVTSGTGRRLNTGIPLAGKTGTTGMTAGTGNKDIWTTAYNPDYCAVVWMGFDDTDAQHSLPSDATGGTYPAELLSALFDALYPSKTAAPAFEVPEGIVEVRLDGASLEEGVAVLANAMTPADSVVTEYFTQDTVPTETTKYWAVPSSVKKVSLSLNEQGRPVVSFGPPQAFVRYRIYRAAGGGEPVLIAELPGDMGRIDYEDNSAPYGVVCQYYVQPVHPEMTLAGEPVTGPSTASASILPQALAAQLW